MIRKHRKFIPINIIIFTILTLFLFSASANEITNQLLGQRERVQKVCDQKYRDNKDQYIKCIRDSYQLYIVEINGRTYYTNDTQFARPILPYSGNTRAEFIEGASDEYYYIEVP